MKTSITLLLFLSAFILSCSKDPLSPEKKTSEPVYSDYMPLKIGNYWIYQYFNTDENGDEIFTNTIDSVFISKDTLIQDRIYYKLEKTRTLWNVYIPSFISDSSGYLLSSPGRLILSPDSTETYQEDSEYYLSTSFSCRKDSLVNTPAGIFNNTITYRTFNEGKNGMGNGYTNRVFAKNIGMIQRNLFYSSAPEKPVGIKLIRYRLH